MLKKLYEKINKQEFPLITASHCIDVSSTWLGARIYGPEGEKQPVARMFMKNLGPDIGIPAYDLAVYTPLIYSLPLIAYGLEAKLSEKLGNSNKHVKRMVDGHYISNIALAGSISSRFYLAGVQNVVDFIKSLNIPEPWNKIVPIVAATSVGVPYAYSLVKHYSKKFGGDGNSSKPVKPESVIVLGKGSRNDELLEGGKRRVDGGLKLRSLYKSNLIFTGGKTNKQSDESEAELMSEYALEQERLAEDLYLEQRGKDLVGNMIFSEDWLKKTNTNNTAIVTSEPFKTRTNLVAQTILKKYNPRVYFVKGDREDYGYKDRIKEKGRTLLDIILITPMKIFGKENGKKIYNIYQSKLLSKFR